jgi:hypothetical protein
LGEKQFFPPKFGRKAVFSAQSLGEKQFFSPKFVRKALFPPNLGRKAVFRQSFGFTGIK